MSFNQFKSLSDVLKKYSLTYQKENCFQYPLIIAPDILKQELDFTFNHVPYNASETAICENLIYPILKQAWKDYANVLAIWSQVSLNYNKELSGIPDYLIAKRSPLGVIVLDLPYVAVVEAKRDDFSGGWGQCGAEMVAMQQINADVNLPVYGIVSNGEIWEFAQLEKQTFTFYKQRFDIANLDILFSVLIAILEACKQRVNLN
ncbi:MAG: hypothetical protein RL637_876 [Pseudomonadota bacterium]|jgi:hypothetical protein